MSTPAALSRSTIRLASGTPRGAGAGDPEEAQHGALDGDGGVAADEIEDRVDDLLGQLARVRNLRVFDERSWHGGTLPLKG